MEKVTKVEKVEKVDKVEKVETLEKVKKAKKSGNMEKVEKWKKWKKWKGWSTSLLSCREGISFPLSHQEKGGVPLSSREGVGLSPPSLIQQRCGASLSLSLSLHHLEKGRIFLSL